MHALPAADRRRALALMGVDVYLLRDRAGASAAAAAEALAFPPPTPVAGSPRRADAAGPRVVFALPDGSGFDGPHGGLLRHLALALGLDPAAVSVGPARADLPCVCLGGAPGEATDVLLAPPPAALRASAAARRALWPALRALARRLGR